MQRLRRIRRCRGCSARRQRRTDAAVQEVGEQRAEDRCTERTADRAKERHPRRGDAEVFETRRVLHDQHQHLHARPDTGAEDEQVNRLQQCRCGRVHPGHQQKSKRHHRRSGDREDLVSPGPADQDTAAYRRREHPGDHRQRAQTRCRRRDPVDELHVGRQEGQRAQHREADHERQHAAHREDRIGEQPRRQDGRGFRPRRTAFDPDKDAQRRRGGGEQTDDRRRAPRIGGATPAGGQRQAGRAQADEQDAGVVDDRLPARGQRRDRRGRNEEDDDRDRHVDPERPPPGQVVGEIAAQQRADHRGHTKHRAQRALIAAAIP